MLCLLLCDNFRASQLIWEEDYQAKWFQHLLEETWFLEKAGMLLMPAGLSYSRLETKKGLMDLICTIVRKCEYAIKPVIAGIWNQEQGI